MKPSLDHKMKQRVTLPPLLLYLILSAALLFITGCQTATLASRSHYMNAYREGRFEEASLVIDKSVSKSVPAGDYKRSKEAVWLLLDRATTRFAAGNSKKAVEDYRLAIEAIDFYSQKVLSETIGQGILDDSVSAYSGEDFEQILARVYMALALLHEGDVTNAHAMLRQAEEVQQRKRELYLSNNATKEFKLVDNSAAKYLLALLSEKKGDAGNAAILYRQCEELSVIDLQQMESSKTGNATILIVGHNGNAPCKISVLSPASAASGAVLETILASSHTRLDPAWSSLTGIPIPVLTHQGLYRPVPLKAKVDGCLRPLIPIFDVSETAHEQLQQQLPIIAARGVARMLVRRAAVGCAQQQDPNLGALTDFAMLIANLNTKADTRSWSTLPSSIDLARFDVAPGIHKLNIERCGDTVTQMEKVIHIKAGELCVINLFNIHPKNVSLLIPDRFQIKNKEN